MCSARMPSELDCAKLFQSMQALSAHPFAFIQMIWFITGRNASDPGSTHLTL